MFEAIIWAVLGATLVALVLAVFLRLASRLALGESIAFRAAFLTSFLVSLLGTLAEAVIPVSGSAWGDFALNTVVGIALWTGGLVAIAGLSLRQSLLVAVVLQFITFGLLVLLGLVVGLVMVS